MSECYGHESPLTDTTAQDLPRAATDRFVPVVNGKSREVCRSVKDDSFLTTADALAYLKTTPRTLYRRLANGEIPAVRLGRQWRFRKGDLDRWVGRGDESASRGVPQAEPRSAPPRVLIADDDADVLETLVNILAVTDYRIETVRNGVAAVTQLQQTAYRPPAHGFDDARSRRHRSGA